MSINPEIQALREELARLRERVAVLEAQPPAIPNGSQTSPLPWHTIPLLPRDPYSKPFPNWTITC